MAGLKSCSLAAVAGWKPSRLRNYEARIREPNLDGMRTLVNAFDSIGVKVSIDELFPSHETKKENVLAFTEDLKRSIRADIELIKSHIPFMINEMDIVRSKKTIAALEARLKEEDMAA